MAISVIKRDKSDEIFNYSSIIEREWTKIIQDAKDFYNIHFDLENNDSTGEKKTFYIKKDLRKGQSIKYEINADLCKAGGDWEHPVMYFKIELTHDYGLKMDRYKSNPKYIWDLPKKDYGGLFSNYVIIPPIKAGNKLVKNKDGWRAYQDEDIPKDNKNIADIEDKDYKIAWKWLEELLENAVEERHEMLDENKIPKLKEIYSIIFCFFIKIL